MHAQGIPDDIAANNGLPTGRQALPGLANTQQGTNKIFNFQ